MRLSQNFTKTFKQAPADEVAKNAQLLIRAGFVHKVMAGVYAYTPLGLRVVEKIKQIVREEMNALGAQELIMTNLQSKEPWETTGRWDEKVVDIWFKTKLQDDTELGLAWSHEEPILDMLRQYVQSYKDFPVKVYQFQTKLRNELRAKSGIMRGREFLMKDMYSLHATAEELDEFYKQTIEAYQRCYDRLGVGDDTYVTFASGGAFTQFSHEFQTVSEVGEDTIYLHRAKNIAVNEEVLDDKTLADLDVERDELEPANSVEAGNIFNFGSEKCEQMNIYFTDQDGKRKPAYLGSYGIGITRMMGLIVEKFADDKGIVWPENIAPARVYLVSIGDVADEAQKFYEELQSKGVETIWDDRDLRPGEKFGDADLFGIPHRVVISPKTLEQNSVEYKARTSDETELLTKEVLLARLG